MKILLVSPNTLKAPYPVYPIGLDYVAGSVAKEHEVQICDLNSCSLEQLASLLTQYAPTVIGLSCRNIDTTDAGDPQYFITQYTKIVSWIRQWSQAIIVCGGSGFTIMPEKILRALQADYGVVGEGERFGLLIDALNNGIDATTIPGIITRKSQEIELPPPLKTKGQRHFRSQAPHNQFYLEKGGMLNLQSKRGCGFNCIYCPYPHIEGHNHRLVAPEKVARTAMDLQEAGAKYFFITDSAFNSDIEHSLEVARAFKKIGVSIPWGGFFAPTRLPDDFFTIMADAGLAHVEFGTETLSDSMLKTYRKPFRVDDVFAAHKKAVDAGIHVAHYFLMGGPGESEATIHESMDNMEQLKKTVLFCFIGIRIYPHTEMYNIAIKEGKITKDTDLLEPVFYEADDIDRDSIEKIVTDRFGQRINWIVGSGGSGGASTVSKMHERGYTGPLWEFLIR